MTWNRETLAEDTAFVWKAAERIDLEFELADVAVSVRFGGLFLAVSLTVAAFTAFWFLSGVAYYGRETAGWALAVPLAPSSPSSTRWGRSPACSTRPKSSA